MRLHYAPFYSLYMGICGKFMHRETYISVIISVFDAYYKQNENYEEERTKKHQIKIIIKTTSQQTCVYVVCALCMCTKNGRSHLLFCTLQQIFTTLFPGFHTHRDQPNKLFHSHRYTEDRF